MIPDPIYRLGVSLSQSGHTDRAIPAYRRAAALGFAPTFSWYNLACAYAVIQDPEHAFEALDSLMARGYRQPQALETDTDLASLKADPRFAAVVARARKNAFPCESDPRSREFDFWIGEWDVQDKNSGSRVGTSSVQLILGSCVIFENWTDVFGSSGKSLNSFNRAQGWWQQNWVDDSGVTTDFTNGLLDGNAMVYQSSGKAPDGTNFARRLTFFNLGPDRVRQFSERSTDGGKSWSTEYDFIYLRKK